MSKLVCLQKSCPYRSKRPLKTVMVGGKPAYTCTLPVVTLNEMFDPDGDTYKIFGYNPVQCTAYMRYKESAGGDNEP